MNHFIVDKIMMTEINIVMFLIARFGFKMHEPNGEGLKDKKVALLVVVKDQMKTTAFQVLADLILAPQDFLGPKMQRLEVLLLLHPIARVP